MVNYLRNQGSSLDQIKIDLEQDGLTGRAMDRVSSATMLWAKGVETILGHDNDSSGELGSILYVVHDAIGDIEEKRLYQKHVFERDMEEKRLDWIENIRVFERRGRDTLVTSVGERHGRDRLETN